MIPRATKHLFTASLFALLVLTGCDVFSDEDRDNTFTAEESFRFDVAVEAQDLLRLEAVNGTIKVEGEVGATSITITGMRRVRSDSQADAEEYLAKLEVRLLERDDEVFAYTIQPSNADGRNYEVEYRITIPADWATIITQVNGTIEVERLENDVDIDNVNGEIFLEDIVGDARVNLVNGGVTAAVAMPDDGRILFTLVNGNLDLTIPTSTSALLEASVTNGTINTSNLSLTEVENSAKRLKGTLGDGAGDIEMKTVNGNIRIRGENGAS